MESYKIAPMPYIKLFETSIKADFEKACAMLERENIKYEALYEYRLEREKDYDPFGNSGAILSVPRSVYHDANPFGDLYNGKYAIKSSFWTNDISLTSTTTRIVLRE